MTDQLSLLLDPALPRLPSLRPMLARPLPEPFDSTAHLFEPVWGGARALACIGPAVRAGEGDVRLVAEDGTEGPAPLDLAGLAARVDARSAVLDGEVVVVDDAGRLDHEEMARRLAGEPGRPMSYLAFDLLDLDGRSLLNLALDKRRALLRQVLRPGDEVVAVPAIASEGRALFEAVSGQGLYGIRARQRASPYLPGVRSRLWRTIAVGGGGARRDPVDEGTADGGGTGRTELVLALIRRLPLEFDDEDA
ncbi:MAG: bifunctional non-ous end joining protein LigD [Chloroflexota bacterium]|nr:bifunctional non-ous end joining protein LigD [Chloroflexota bacterium]